MTITQFTKEIYLEEGNVRCKIEVETGNIGWKYGGEYEGKKVFYAGLDGRIADVPAFLGDIEIKHVDNDRDGYKVFI